MVVSVELELFVYVFALFKGLTGLHLALKQRKADDKAWYCKKLRTVEGAVILLLLTSVITLSFMASHDLFAYPITLVVDRLAIIMEIMNTVLLAIFMIYIVWRKVGYEST